MLRRRGSRVFPPDQLGGRITARVHPNSAERWHYRGWGGGLSLGRRARPAGGGGGGWWMGG